MSARAFAFSLLVAIAFGGFASPSLFAQANTSAEQIACAPADCVEFYFNPKTVVEKLDGLMARNAGKILIKFGTWRIKHDHENLDDVKRFIRGVARRDGRVIVEPVYLGIRGAASPMAVKDLVFNTYEIIKRVWHSWRYRRTANYNVKILYHPHERHIMYIYFVHRNYGDICVVLKSRCAMVEYRDDETFDLALAERLRWARANKRELRVVFNDTTAYLPRYKISLETLERTDVSLRLYKWLLASGKVRKRNLVKKRFMSITAASTLLDYGLKAYDAVRSYLMYKPARSMRTEVLYTGKESGGKINTVIFTPADIADAAPGCLF